MADPATDATEKMSDRKATGRKAADSLLDFSARSADAASHAADNLRVNQDPNTNPPRTAVPSFKRGGIMRHKGTARLHKGERIKGRSSRGR